MIFLFEHMVVFNGILKEKSLEFHCFHIVLSCLQTNLALI